MMKSLVIAVCLVVVAVSAAPADPVQVAQYEDESFDNERGEYYFRFIQSDGTKQEQRGELRNRGSENEYLYVTGTYSWIAPDGVEYSVKYESDDNGYRVLDDQGNKRPPGAPLEIANALLG